MDRRRQKLVLGLLILICLSACIKKVDTSIAEDLEAPDHYTLKGEKSFISDYEPILDDGMLQIVVEIPTGTVAKWEVSKPKGFLKWEFKKGKPRKVKYLGYPGNYGMIPRTALPYESGGDGDPLDVLVLGPPMPRGSIIKAKLIGVLKLLDRGEQDDKLIAVMKNTPFYEVNSISELDKRFNGVSMLIETWFKHYKGPGKLKSRGYANAEVAQAILKTAIASYLATVPVGISTTI